MISAATPISTSSSLLESSESGSEPEQMSESASESIPQDFSVPEQADEAASVQSNIPQTSPEAQTSTPEPAKTEPSNQPKPLELVLENNRIALGEAVILHLKNAGNARISVQTDLPFTPTFYRDGEQHTALLPIAYTVSPGYYHLSLKAADQTLRYAITVTDREFQVQHLTMDEGIENTVNTQKANQEWAQKIEPLKFTGDANKYWEGTFLPPVPKDTPISTEFGAIRYTNGSTIATRHSGIDFAAARGTQVIAVNSGRVQFAGYLQLTGNTVVIEHGFGLKSFYYHMDSISVEQDEMLQKGDPVGKVGSTGYSTGPHLHYSLLVNNVFVNPWTAFSRGFD